MNITKICVIGAGGLGKEIQSAIDNHPHFEFAGFYDDKPGVGILGKIADINISSEVYFLIGVADPQVRNKIHSGLTEISPRYATFIHPLSNLEDSKSIIPGEGSVVCAGVQMTRNIQLGKFSVINLNSTIGHDVIAGDFFSAMPGCHISGGVTLGNRCYVGSGAVILPGLSVGDDVIIGAGCVVTKDLVSGSKVAGVPARLI